MMCNWYAMLLIFLAMEQRIDGLAIGFSYITLELPISLSWCLQLYIISMMEILLYICVHEQRELNTCGFYISSVSNLFPVCELLSLSNCWCMDAFPPSPSNSSTISIFCAWIF